MRLSLRTLLAFEDNIFDLEQRRQLERTIPLNETATKVLCRIRDVMRDPHLGVPGIVDRHEELDPNFVAEYIDHQMSPEYLEPFESFCLSDDKYLAEVASTHQIVSNVLGEPARTNRECRFRCYDLFPSPQHDMIPEERGRFHDEERLLEEMKTQAVAFPKNETASRGDDHSIPGRKRHHGRYNIITGEEESPPEPEDDAAAEQRLVQIVQTDQTPCSESGRGESSIPETIKRKPKEWSKHPGILTLIAVLLFALVALSAFCLKLYRENHYREDHARKAGFAEPLPERSIPAETVATTRISRVVSASPLAVDSPSKRKPIDPENGNSPVNAPRIATAPPPPKTSPPDFGIAPPVPQTGQAPATQAPFALPKQDLAGHSLLAWPVAANPAVSSQTISKQPVAVSDPATAKSTTEVNASSEISPESPVEPDSISVKKNNQAELLTAPKEEPSPLPVPSIAEPKDPGKTNPLREFSRQGFARPFQSPSDGLSGFGLIEEDKDARSEQNKDFPKAAADAGSGFSDAGAHSSGLESPDPANGQSDAVAASALAENVDFHVFAQKNENRLSEQATVSFPSVLPAEARVDLKQPSDETDRTKINRTMQFHPVTQTVNQPPPPQSVPRPADFSSEESNAKKSRSSTQKAGEFGIPSSVIKHAVPAGGERSASDLSPIRPQWFDAPIMPVGGLSEHSGAMPTPDSPLSGKAPMPVAAMVAMKAAGSSGNPTPLDRVLGRVTTSQEPTILFSAASANAPWKLESGSVDVFAEHYLLTSAPFRCDLELGDDFRIEMIGDAKLCIMPLDEQGVPGIFLDYGRLIIRARFDKDPAGKRRVKPLRIRTEKTEGVLTISGPRSLVFVDTFAEVVENHLSDSIVPDSENASPLLEKTSSILGLLPDPSESVSWTLAGRDVPFVAEQDTSFLLDENRNDRGTIRNHPNWLRRISLPPEGREIEAACRRVFHENGHHNEAALHALIRESSLPVRSFGLRLWGDLGRFDVPLMILSETKDRDEPVNHVMTAYFREVMKRDEESVQRLADAIQAVRR